MHIISIKLMNLKKAKVTRNNFNFINLQIICKKNLILGQEPSLSQGISKLTVSASAQQKQHEILKQIEQPFVPKDPPAEFEFIADPPSISALDL